MKYNTACLDPSELSVKTHLAIRVHGKKKVIGLEMCPLLVSRECGSAYLSMAHLVFVGILCDISS